MFYFIIFQSGEISISSIIINFILLPLMLSEGGEENSIYHAFVIPLNQSASKHGRHTFLYSAMRQRLCKAQLLARTVLRQLRGSGSNSIFQQQFGENHGDDCCYSIYFDSDTILWLLGLLWKFSNDDTWA